jgi:hypothetical protein
LGYPLIFEVQETEDPFKIRQKQLCLQSEGDFFAFASGSALAGKEISIYS